MSPSTPPTLLDFQTRAVDRLSPILQSGASSLLIGPTGTGKTYTFGQILSNLFHDPKWSDKIKNHQGFAIFVLTKASVVCQTQEVLFKDFGLPTNKILICNYDKLRSQIGEIWISWQEKILSNGVTVEKPYWNNDVMPLFIIADECQALRNDETLQTQIILQYIKQGGQLLLSSATPFTRVSEAKTVSLALKPRVIGGFDVKTYLNEKLWPSFAESISGHYAPSDYNAEAVKRLGEALDDKIVRFEGVKFKKRCFSHCKLIPFQSAKDLLFYQDAYDSYLRELAKINKDAPGGIAAIWVAQLKFRMAAELVRAPYLAQIGKHVQETDQKQIIIASNFVQTLESVRNNLINLGIKEDQISIIWGQQDLSNRQKNIKRFQNGKSLYCLFTLKSGGVGLSLHHHEGNADVCLPRYIVLPPTWSAIEIVQALGRGHRINSISTTIQDIIWFSGTIEEQVAAKVAKKLTSLKEIVTKKENWTDVFSNRNDLGKIKELIDKNEELSIDQEDDIKEDFAIEAYDSNKDIEVSIEQIDDNKQQINYEI